MQWWLYGKERTMIAECEVSQKIVRVLSGYFFMKPEVWSKCGKNRIDFIMTCKKSLASFGLEVKKIDKKRGNDIGELILQAQRYVKSEFKINGVYKRVPIFIAPPISYDILMCPDELLIHDGHEFFKDRHHHDHKHHTVNGMLGALEIGEVRTIKNDKFERYFNLTFSNQIIWTSKKQWGSNEIRGLHQDNYDKLLKKLDI